jgi:hypothetical protein
MGLTMKSLGVGAFAIVMVAGLAWAQQAAAPPPAQLPAKICLSQYTPMPGQSAAGLITAGYDIKAAVPGGLWVQKDREVYYCNSGRPLETEPLCWRLREPSAGNFC